MKTKYCLMLLALAFFLSGCRTEVTNDAETTDTRSDFRKTLKLKQALVFKNYLSEIKSNPLAVYGKNENPFLSLSDETTVTVITQHNTTSYSTVIRNSDKSSEVLVYSVDHENNSFGLVAEYTPDDKTKNYDIDNFTGTVQYTAMDGRPMGIRQLDKGVPLPPAIQQTASTSKGDCSYTINLIEVVCGDSNFNHTPAEYSSCKDGEKPYYIVEIAEICKSSGQPPKGLPNMFYDGGGGGSSSSTINMEVSIEDSFNLMLNENGFPELSAEEYAYIQSNQYIGSQLLSYFSFNLTQERSKLLHGALQYLIQNSNPNEVFITRWKKFEPLLFFADQFIQQNLDTLNIEQFFTRIQTLENALTQNPNLLLDIPCGELPRWQDVAMHQVPQSVKTKLQNIKNQTSWWSNWKITDLDDGASARINMDVFPIKISSLPHKPNSTQKYTPEEFFNFFRLNLNFFAEKFTPIVDSNYGINDTALWNSSNPLGALIHIEIPIDNGTVVCSGFGPKAWVFSTIKAPMDMGHDGVHPVAGNRLFGYYVDANDNTMYIYTRGVDRVSQVATNFPNLANYLIEVTAFHGADQLWRGMQDKLSEYINDRGGIASKIPETTYRINYSKARNYLKGNALISSLGCH